ncbi:ATP-binding protein, partial [Gordonibacter pamelaeae]
SYGEEHGLGLVLVDRIARAHGGSLVLKGEPGRGFAVEVLLPLA